MVQLQLLITSYHVMRIGIWKIQEIMLLICCKRMESTSAKPSFVERERMEGGDKKVFW